MVTAMIASAFGHVQADTHAHRAMAVRQVMGALTQIKIRHVARRVQRVMLITTIMARLVRLASPKKRIRLRAVVWQHALHIHARRAPFPMQDNPVPQKLRKPTVARFLRTHRRKRRLSNQQRFQRTHRQRHQRTHRQRLQRRFQRKRRRSNQQRLQRTHRQRLQRSLRRILRRSLQRGIRRTL
jgi:hypothetical protein